MRRDEVLQFLQLVNYDEILPLDVTTAQFKEIAGYCRQRGLVTVTPDNNCMISEKGLALLTGKVQWEALLPFGKNILLRDDKSAKIVYRLGGATVCGLLIYELVIKGFLR
jgi:hypothetical protein